MASTVSPQHMRRDRPLVRAFSALEGRITRKYLLQLLLVFIAYVIAGKLGQAPGSIRSSNLGPVWPAYGVALASFLICGYRVWPAVAAAAFLVAFFSPVPHLAALGQAAGATLSAMTGAFLMRRFAGFNTSLSRLSDALSLIGIGGFGSATLSASLGVLVLYATHVQAYSGLGDAWLIYWLGDATGVLLVTPLALRLADLSKLRDRNRIPELVIFLLVLVATSLVIFSRPFVPSELDDIAFAMLPFIIFAAIRLGVAVTALSTLIVAAIATVGTALGVGPFASHTAFDNAVLLDVLFSVLSISGLCLAAVIEERQHAEGQREQVVSKQAAMEARLEAAHELRLSEQRWQLAAHAGKMYAYEWDVATDTIVRSGEVADVLGPIAESSSLSRQQLLARVHPDDRAIFIASTNERTPENPDTQISYRILGPDGSVIWLEKTAHASFDEHGRMLRVVGMVSNVTERKQREERLREYEKAVEGAEEMIAVVDREYRYLIANRQFLKMRNMTQEQVLGHAAGEVLNQGIFEAVVKEKLDECFQGKVVRYETKYTYPEHGERNMLISYFPIEGANGIDRAACILQDITDRKRAQEALRESEDKLRLLLDSTAEAIYGIDVKGCCTFANPACVRALGYQTVDELLGNNMHYLIHHSRADGSQMQVEECKVFRALRGGEGTHVDDEVLWRRDGTSFPVEYWSYPQRRGKEIVGAVVAFTDISERRKSEEALAGMSRKLIEAQEQERTRIARELHDDINQRLALMAIEMEIAKQNPPNSAGRMSRLLTEFQNRITEVSSQVHTMSHQLHSSQLLHMGVAVAMNSFCCELAERQNLQIDFSHDDLPKAVSSEVSLCLFRIMQEALHNAAKHSNVRHIEVKLGCSVDHLHLTVSDRGTGFDVETAMNKGGLGLISMRERVRLVNGAIVIESKPMAGTTIQVRVPFASERRTQPAAGKPVS